MRVGTIKKAEHQRVNALELKKTLESPLDWKEIKPVTPNGNQLWILIGKADAEAKAPILWPPDAKSCLIGKDPDAGKDWGQEKGTTEDEMVGWHHWLNESESLDLSLLEKTQGDSEGQGSLACCSSWDMSWLLKNNNYWVLNALPILSSVFNEILSKIIEIIFVLEMRKKKLRWLKYFAF